MSRLPRPESVQGNDRGHTTTRSCDALYWMQQEARSASYWSSLDCYTRRWKSEESVSSGHYPHKIHLH
jgi:hypothetical protein